jgi:pimeloyl-ACP methyl ester carboxylesterase
LALRPLAAGLVLTPDSAANHPDRVCDVEAWVEATPPENLANELDTFADAPDLVGSLGSIACPVLARVGALDAAAPVAMSEAIVRAVARGRLEVVPNAAHALTLEEPAATADSVARFVAVQ